MARTPGLSHIVSILISIWFFFCWNNFNHFTLVSRRRRRCCTSWPSIDGEKKLKNFEEKRLLKNGTFSVVVRLIFDQFGGLWGQRNIGLWRPRRGNYTGEIFLKIKKSYLILLCNWVIQWSWHTWVQFNTDLFRVTRRFICTMNRARHLIWLNGNGDSRGAEAGRVH